MATSPNHLTFMCAPKRLPHVASVLFHCKHIKILYSIKKIRPPSLPRTIHKLWPHRELARWLAAKIGSRVEEVLLL